MGVDSGIGTMPKYKPKYKNRWTGYSSSFGNTVPNIPGYNAPYPTAKQTRDYYKSPSRYLDAITRAKRAGGGIQATKKKSAAPAYSGGVTSQGYTPPYFGGNEPLPYGSTQDLQELANVAKFRESGAVGNVAQVYKTNAQGRPIVWTDDSGKLWTRASWDRANTPERGVGQGQFEGMSKEQIEAYLNQNYPAGESNGAVFNPDIPRAGEDWINYMMENGVLPYFGTAEGISGKWTDYLLGRMGATGYGINPYARPFDATPQEPQYQDYASSGYGGYGGYGGGYGGGSYPRYPSGGGGGNYSYSPTPSSGVSYGQQGYGPRTQDVPRWVQSLVNWRL